MKSKIAKFVKESVEWLQEKQEGCCRYKLDDHLAIFVGWSAGYGDEKCYDIIQAEDDLDWAINVGIKVWTSDYMQTDYDFLNFPYFADGEVLDLGMSIAPDENYESLADDLLHLYNNVKDLILNDNGQILEDIKNDN